MAGRIRTAKNEFDEQDRVARLTDGAYRLFCGVRSLADDRGDCPGEPSYLARLFYGRPRSLAVIGKLIDELEMARLVDRYTADGARYLAIIGWLEEGSPTYQRIDKPQKPKYPLPTSVRSWNGRGTVAEDSTLDGKGSEGEGNRSGGEWEDEPEAGRSRGTGSTPTPMPVGWVWDPEASELDRAAHDQAIARGVDIGQQMASLRDHALERGMTSRDWRATARRWLGKAHPAPPQAGKPPPARDPRVGQVQPKPSSAYGPDGEQSCAFDEPAASVDDRLTWAAAARVELGHERPATPEDDEQPDGAP